MFSKKEQNYLAKHRTIRQILVELTKEGGRACVNVSQLAARLGMDPRTVRSHLRIMEVDMIGVFMDGSERQFCTKEGISLLANILDEGKEAESKSS